MRPGRPLNDHPLTLEVEPIVIFPSLHQTAEQRLLGLAAIVDAALVELCGEASPEQIRQFSELVRLVPATAPVEGVLSALEVHARQVAARAEERVLFELVGAGSQWTFDAPPNERAVA